MMIGEKGTMTTATTTATTSTIATKEDADPFCGSCVPLRALWEHFRTLFEGSDKRRELLETLRRFSSAI
jgi:hypothetical protein